ncbi:MAG: hypothetical protein US49_C0001G0284 [candidate division TM6 bacterium GW2011_GWF2_37_49]|nr:MAG: hypothetical protein US49_C0001G0284 [candidate division TM6 bacterium GW2011_GWF2_37_49]
MSFKIKRVFAVVMRHFLTVIKPFKLISQLYWVGLDIVIFGFMSKSTSSVIGAGNQVAFICLFTNLSLWYIVPRAAIGMALTLYEDLIDSSFVGLMATPLTLLELVIAQITIALFCSTINFAMGFICMLLLFGFNVFSIGIVLIPTIISLIISSWIIGIYLVSFSMFFGKKSSSSLYTLPWALIPFCGVFYSVTVLPQVCQTIAHYIPMYHVFDGLTQFIKNGTSINSAILKSMELNVFYFFVAIAVLTFVFKARKKTGLTRLEVEG